MYLVLLADENGRDTVLAHGTREECDRFASLYRENVDRFANLTVFDPTSYPSARELGDILSEGWKVYEVSVDAKSGEIWYCNTLEIIPSPSFSTISFALRYEQIEILVYVHAQSMSDAEAYAKMVKQFIAGEYGELYTEDFTSYGTRYIVPGRQLFKFVASVVPSFAQFLLSKQDGIA